MILIAATGFVNYVLLKLYGARGVELAGFLGGVVLNSLASTAIKLPLVARISGDRGLTLRVALALGVVMALGLGDIFIPGERCAVSRRGWVVSTVGRAE